MSSSSPSTTRGNRDKLLEAAENFCQAFSSRLSVGELVKLFSTQETPSVHEHGLPILAPFLGTAYEGMGGVEEYFKTIAGLLSYDNMHFGDYIVDPQVMKVSVRGEATFTWLSTGQSWAEVFTYALEFDGSYLVKKYEIWADSGAAYLASRGELNFP